MKFCKLYVNIVQNMICSTNLIQSYLHKNQTKYQNAFKRFTYPNSWKFRLHLFVSGHFIFTYHSLYCKERTWCGNVCLSCKYLHNENEYLHKTQVTIMKGQRHPKTSIFFFSRSCEHHQFPLLKSFSITQVTQSQSESNHV